MVFSRGTLSLDTSVSVYSCPFDESHVDDRSNSSAESASPASVKTDVHRCSSSLCQVCSNSQWTPSFISVQEKHHTPNIRRLPPRWWESEEVAWEEVTKAALTLLCPSLEESTNGSPSFDDICTDKDDTSLSFVPSGFDQCCTAEWNWDEDEVPFDEPRPVSQLQLY